MNQLIRIGDKIYLSFNLDKDGKEKKDSIPNYYILEDLGAGYLCSTQSINSSTGAVFNPVYIPKVVVK